MTLAESLVRTDDGAVLWTVSGGVGPPVLLCHGGPGLWDNLGTVAETVDDIVTVHRWDQRGCGRSSGSGPYSIERFVADMESLRKYFGYEGWIVGGHSWGASLALYYALAHPERVDAIVYLSGTGLGTRWKAASRAEQERRLTGEQVRRLAELESRPRNESEEIEFRVLKWSPDYADRERAVEFATEEARAPFRINLDCNAALGSEVRSLDEAELSARCRRLDTPVLVVHGDEDPRPAWAVEGLVNAVEDAELRVLRGVGHLPWLENAPSFENILRDFLSRTIGRQTLES